MCSVLFYSSGKQVTMPAYEAPCAEQCDAPRTPSLGTSLSSSEVSGTSSPEPQNLRPSPLFRALAMPPPDPEQPPGQEELERRVPGYRRIVIPRELTLIELLKQSSGASTDEAVLQIREAKLRVVAERVGLRRLHVLAPCLRSLTLDGSAISSLRDLGSGLVHLKILSVSRCGLTCLDGVWGLGSLRELHAAGNRLQDLQPLAALRKLHTLNLAGNPISEINRLWTLSVCTSLRRLTLQGTPASDEPDYRTRVVMSLPMLIHLDGLPLLTDTEDEIENMFDEASSGSECEEEELPLSKPEPPQLPDKLAPGTSHESIAENPESDVGGPENFDTANNLPKIQHCRRPATTEGAGLRPLRPNIPPRPKTAQERPTVDAPTRLQILNTLMDEEWRCSGSKLTSAGTVCGNLAQALRRPASARRCTQEASRFYEKYEQTLEGTSRAFAAEIPMMPRLGDWEKFKEKTGIDIDIDFNQRPPGDALSAIERLERIEKETSERLSVGGSSDVNYPPVTKFGCAVTIMNDFDLWKAEVIAPTKHVGGDAATLFDDILSSNDEASLHD